MRAVADTAIWTRAGGHDQLLRVALPAAGLALSAALLVGIAAIHSPLDGTARIAGSDTLAALVAPCGRAAPAASRPAPAPTQAEIAAVEAALTPTLARLHPEANWTQFPERWDRLFAARSRGGRRVILADYAPAGAAGARGRSGTFRRRVGRACGANQRTPLRSPRLRNGAVLRR